MFIPYEQRQDTDIIGEEGFFREELDRPIQEINDLFVAAFGDSLNPLRASADAVQRLGQAALLDVGCGTTNTLRTWADEVISLTSCAPSAVTLLGVSLYDYSRESRFPATEALHGTDRIRYQVGDAAEQLWKLPDNSIQVALSFNAFIHMDNPHEVLQQMVRVGADGSLLFFNLSLLQSMRGSPTRNYLQELERSGYITDRRSVRMRSESRAANYILGWIKKPRRVPGLDL